MTIARGGSSNRLQQALSLLAIEREQRVQALIEYRNRLVAIGLYPKLSGPCAEQGRACHKGRIAAVDIIVSVIGNQGEQVDRGHAQLLLIRASRCAASTRFNCLVQVAQQNAVKTVFEQLNLAVYFDQPVREFNEIPVQLQVAS